MSRTLHLAPLSVLPLRVKIAVYSLLPIPYSLFSLRTPSDPHPSAQPLHLSSSSRRRTALHSQPPAESATPAHSHRPSPSPAPAASAESAPGPARPSLPSGRKSSSRPETSFVQGPSGTSSPVTPRSSPTPSADKPAPACHPCS